MLEQAEYASFSRLWLLSTCKEKYNHRYIKHSLSLEPLPDRFRIGKTADDALEAAQHKSNETFNQYMIRKKLEFLDKKWEHFCRGIWEEREALYKRIFGEEDEVVLQLPIELYILNKETGEIISAAEDGRVIPFIGVLDAFKPAKYILYELKTTGGNIEQIFIEHCFKGQTQIYCTGIMEKLKREDIPHVVYVYLKKPRIKQKKNESLEEYYTRMYEAGRNLGIGSGDEIEFRDKDYTREELDETMQYFFDRVHNDLKAIPTKERNSCFQYGERCEYYLYCWKYQQVSTNLIESPDAAA